MLPFTKIDTNLKGSTPIQLGPNTAIVGPNQRGKTAILDAIQLALTGRHPAVRGGPGDAARYIETFAPHGQPLYVNLLGPEGVCSFRAWNEGRSSKKEWAPGAYIQLQDQSFDFAVVGDLLKEGSAVQNELIRRFGQSTASDPPPGCDDKLAALWREALQEASRPGMPSTELLAAVTDVIKKRVLALGRAKGEAERRSSGDPSHWIGVEDLPRVEALLDRAREYERQAAQRGIVEQYDESMARLRDGEASARNARLEQQANQVQRTVWLQAQEARLSELKLELEALEAEIREHDRRIAVLEHIGRLTSSASDQCPVCHTENVDMSSVRAKNVDMFSATCTARDAVKANLNVVFKAYTETNELIQKAKRAWADKDAAIVEVEKWCEMRAGLLEKQRAHVEALRGQVIGTSPGDVRTLEREVAQLRSMRAAKDVYEGAIAERMRIETEQSHWKLLGDLVKRKSDSLVVDAKARAEAIVSLYTTPGMKVTYDMEDDAWKVAGATRDGRPHARSASGFERNLLLPALYLAWTHGQTRFCLLDDTVTGTYDTRHMTELLRVLRGRQEAGDITQNIIVLPPAMANHPALDEVVQGWHRVSL